MNELALFAGAGRISWWDAEPELGRVVDGMASKLDKHRIARLGNGQVPAVAALAWEILGENAKDHTSAPTTGAANTESQ